jgi:rhamnosyltransferase
MHVFQGDSPCLVHSDSYITDEYLNVRKRFFGGNFVGIGLKSSFFNYQVQGSSTMINHYLKELVLPFPDYVYLHDRYLNLMVDLFGTRIYIDTPTMYYRQHRNNLIGSQTYFRKLLRNLNIFKQVFYFEKDKLLFKGIRQDKLPDHKLLNLYAYLTDNSVNRWRKLYLIFKENIPIRLKELFLLLINN